MDKKLLREKYFKKRELIEKDKREILNSKIYENVINSDFVKSNEKICIFISFATELDTHRIIKKLIEMDKKVYVPITDDVNKILHISRLRDFDDLEIGFYNILTPKEEKIELIDKNELDIVFTPGLIFDKRGYRIGFGGGYYDKFFSDINPDILKIGLAYEDFFVDFDLPIEEYDKKIDYLITEKIF